MKSKRIFSNPSRMVLVTIALTLLGTSAGYAQKYQITKLENIPGGVYSQTFAINNAAQVIGIAIDASGISYAVIWNGTKPTIIFTGGEFGAFPYAYPYGINNSGVVVGTLYEESGRKPFVWSSGNLRILPGFVAGLGNSAAGINDAGQIVGAIGYFASLWDSPSAETYSLLPPLKGSDGSYATSINANGQIVGSSALGNLGRATLWTLDSATNLNPLWGWGSAAMINDHGWIVGTLNTGAAVWEPHNTADSLCRPPACTVDSHAYGINVEGDVVGTMKSFLGKYHAFVWTHKHFKAIDLNEEITESVAETTTLSFANGTNDRCMIVADGYPKSNSPATSSTESFVLTLTDQSDCDEP
jgi:probable HAF family extracellular repeat protein